METTGVRGTVAMVPVAVQPLAHIVTGEDVLTANEMVPALLDDMKKSAKVLAESVTPVDVQVSVPLLDEQACTAASLREVSYRK
jgi:hypothetical protein